MKNNDNLKHKIKMPRIETQRRSLTFYMHNKIYLHNNSIYLQANKQRFLGQKRYQGNIRAISDLNPLDHRRTGDENLRAWL